MDVGVVECPHCGKQLQIVKVMVDDATESDKTIVTPVESSVAN